MRTQRENKETAWRAGKRRWPSHDCWQVLHLIGWEDGAIFLEQYTEQSEVKAERSWITFDPQVKSCFDLTYYLIFNFSNIYSYQINAQTELAIRYNDISPLENHHAAIAFEIISQVSDILLTL